MRRARISSAATREASSSWRHAVVDGAAVEGFGVRLGGSSPIAGVATTTKRRGEFRSRRRGARGVRGAIARRQILRRRRVAQLTFRFARADTSSLVNIYMVKMGCS